MRVWLGVGGVLACAARGGVALTNAVHNTLYCYTGLDPCNKRSPLSALKAQFGHVDFSEVRVHLWLICVPIHVRVQSSIHQHAPHTQTYPHRCDGRRTHYLTRPSGRARRIWPIGVTTFCGGCGAITLNVYVSGLGHQGMEGRR